MSSSDNEKRKNKRVGSIKLSNYKYKKIKINGRSNN